MEVLKVDTFQMRRLASQLWSYHFYGAQIVTEKTNDYNCIFITSYPYSPKCFPKGKNNSHFEACNFSSLEELTNAILEYSESLYQSTCLMYNQ